MDNTGADTPATEYHSARSRSASIVSQASEMVANLVPISNKGKRAIGVSSSAKRDCKDQKIYVNSRTGLPVRPPTSFGLFLHALRRNMTNSKLGFVEFNKKATLQWAKMSEEEKEPYVQRAKKLAEQFKKIEASYLRKKVRELQKQIKEYRRATISLGRRVK